MRSGRNSVVAAFLLAMLGVGYGGVSHAKAQTLADGLTGFSQSSDDPIEIEADNLEVLDAQNLAIFRGNVEVVQGTATLTTRELRVHYEGGDGGAIGPGSNQGLRLLEAIGAVEIRSQDQFASGDEAQFDFISELITVTGDVVLQQGENLVRGQRLTVDLTTRESRLDAQSTTSGNRRVTGVFVPGAGQ